MDSIRTACAIGLFAGLLTTCLAQQPLDAAQGHIEAFLHKSTSSQKQLVKQFRASAVDLADVGFAHQRELLAEVRRAKRIQKKSKLGKLKRPKEVAPNGAVTWQLPAVVTYRYGLGHIEPVLRSGGRSAQQRAELRAPAELFLLGMLPDADLVVAELQVRMDGDRSADAFMRFLEVWRNGDESFYEALDRTAGTEDSVFFYDAMLGDYVSMFGKGGGAAAKHLKKSLDAAHDALHRSFLRYRQYRAFRETVALSLVLPPDIPLPAHLQRYEEAAGGLYSLRDQVMMVLAVRDHDPRIVAQLVRDSAPPLPDPLWSAGYDPYAAWNKIFEAAMPEMIELGGDTDRFLAEAKKAWIERAALVRAEARAMLGAS